jgi:hypothetical protein
VLAIASLLAGRRFIRGERIRFPLIVIGCFLFPLIATIRSLFGAAFPPINFWLMKINSQGKRGAVAAKSATPAHFAVAAQRHYCATIIGKSATSQ